VGKKEPPQEDREGEKRKWRSEMKAAPTSGWTTVKVLVLSKAKRQKQGYNPDKKGSKNIPKEDRNKGVTKGGWGGMAKGGTIQRNKGEQGVQNHHQLEKLSRPVQKVSKKKADKKNSNPKEKKDNRQNNHLSTNSPKQGRKQ